MEPSDNKQLSKLISQKQLTSMAVFWMLMYLPNLMAANVLQKVNRDLAKLASFNQTAEVIANRPATEFTTIGADANCDVDSNLSQIQNVIDTGIAEIRVASNGTYFNTLVIDNQSVVIRGGFADCTAADNNDQSIDDLTVINGSFISAPVIRITGRGLAERQVVRLENLTITAGTSLAGALGGGLSLDETELELQMQRVLVTGNSGSSVAGVYINNGLGINSGAIDIYAEDVVIAENDAFTHSGGIHCIGLANIAFTGMSGVFSNEAQSAAGLSMQNGCYIAFYSEQNPGSYALLSGIAGNRSSEEAGGAKLSTGANLFLFGQKMCVGDQCLGSNQQPVYLSNNHADVDNNGSDGGGGLYLESFNNDVYANGVIIEGNSASGNGGGIYVSNNTNVTIERRAGGCWNNDRCNLIINNTAGTNNGFGGAFYVNGGALDLSQSYVEESRADFGTAIYATGDSATVTIEGSVFDDNGNQGNDNYFDFSVINASFGADIVIKHSTFADNNAMNSVFDVDPALGGTLSLLSSIVADSSTGNLFAVASSALTVDCLVAHESTSYSGTNVVVASPVFFNPSIGDYHLTPISPAIDLCQAIPLVNTLDIDGESRGWDDPQNNNGSGAYDAGADESYLNDVIFEDGFEPMLAAR